jgi:hypothetical protein
VTSKTAASKTNLVPARWDTPANDSEEERVTEREKKKKKKEQKTELRQRVMDQRASIDPTRSGQITGSGNKRPRDHTNPNESDNV